MNNFNDYAAEFREELLPIIPHDAPIHPDSSHLIPSRGKVPGRMRGGLWSGFAGWTNYHATAEDMLAWHGSGAGIGMQGRRFPAIDIDVDVPELADVIHTVVEEALGAAPVRFGRGSRRILTYAADGLRKRRLAFQAKDPGLRTAKPQAVELLGAGQQYVVEGIHPGTGQPYHWRDGRSPATVGSTRLQNITGEQIDALFDKLVSLLDLFGYEVVGRTSGTASGRSVWQEGLLAPSVEAVGRALAALPNEGFGYDEWVKVGLAICASCGPEHNAEALQLFMDWSLQWPENTEEQVEEKWSSFVPPFRVGWDYLASLATEEGDGTFYAAHEDFEPVCAPPPPGQESKGPLISDKVQAVFERWVWVEKLQRMCDLKTGELLNREQFNVRNGQIGDPTSHKDNAWAQLTRDTRRLQAVKGVTYRPGQGLFVEEDMGDLTGRCVNQWRDPGVNLPATATDADVKPWLEHVAFVLPNPEERETVLSWLAWIIQNPGLKPNWALVIGSTYEGLGKDLMMEPVRVALGGSNVREISPDDLDSQYTWFLAKCRLVLVEEMKLSERKATMNRLKPLVAAPPKTLSVNKKFEPQYEIPNIIAAVFFTNVENALAIGPESRRYYVTWNDGPPRPAEYYEGLVGWYATGGAALAARWLMDRDVSSFKAQGRAPDTVAKNAMVLAGRSLLDELIEDDLRDREGLFADRLFTLDEVSAEVRERVRDPRLPNTRVAAVLRKNGCVAVGRLSLGLPPPGCRPPLTELRKMTTVFGRRGDELEGASHAEIKEVFWADRRTGGTDRSILTVVPK